MIRARDILLSVLLAAAPLALVSAPASAQTFALASPAFDVATSLPQDVAGQIDGYRRDKAREEAEGGQRLELGDIVRRVQAGREGRMLGVRPEGDTYVVRWEYPGGRISDITVDARSGRIIGER